MCIEWFQRGNEQVSNCSGDESWMDKTDDLLSVVWSSRWQLEGASDAVAISSPCTRCAKRSRKSGCTSHC